MNKQRKVLITITYNEMGIIIDTKAQEVAQPDLQQTCNSLATDCISRQAAIDAIYEHEFSNWCDKDEVSTILNDLPSEEPEVIRCKDCKHYTRDDYGIPYCMANCDYGWGDNDFCSYAERRTDEAD